MTTKAYQAYGKAGRTTQATPRAAALDYFDRFPTSRKCNVTEGEDDGHFFTVRYCRTSAGEWPYSVKDVTKRTALDLPA